MFNKISLPLVILSSTAIAQVAIADDNLQIILDKLNKIEQRLDNLENTPNAAKTTQKPANTSPQQTPNSQIKKDEMVSGVVVKIKQPNEQGHKWFESGLKNDHFAGFVTTSYNITTEEIYKNTIGYTGAYGFVAEGYFNAKEQGLYNFGALHQRTKNNYDSAECLSRISINGTMIAEESERLSKNESTENNMLVSGSVTLEPGIYEYSIFSMCGDNRKNNAVKRTFLVKTPKDLSMREIKETELMHKK